MRTIGRDAVEFAAVVVEDVDGLFALVAKGMYVCIFLLPPVIVLDFCWRMRALGLQFYAVYEICLFICSVRTSLIG